jgi:hypothetical protein
VYPDVNTDCMNAFLEQMSQYLGTLEAFLSLSVWDSCVRQVGR